MYADKNNYNIHILKNIAYFIATVYMIRTQIICGVLIRRLKTFTIIDNFTNIKVYSTTHRIQ